MSRSLILTTALLTGLLGCMTEQEMRYDYAINRVDNASGKARGRPPIYHDERRPDGGRDMFDDSFDEQTEPEVLEDRSFSTQLAEQRSKALYEDARAHFDRGEYGPARIKVRQVLRYRTTIKSAARELLTEIDEKLRAEGKDPATVGAGPGASKAAQTIAAALERGAELLRQSNYERAIEEYELALEATGELPDTAERVDVRLQLRSLIRLARRQRAKDGLAPMVR